MEGFIGNTVSITLKKNISDVQQVLVGNIVDFTAEFLTINKCIHNGYTLKRQATELKINKMEILDLKILKLNKDIPTRTPVKPSKTPKVNPKREKKASHSDKQHFKTDEPEIIKEQYSEKDPIKVSVIEKKPEQYANEMQLEFSSKQEYNTDEGIIIPSIPQSLRNRIQNLADTDGFLMERQNDMLARGAVDLALQLLGGARRFTPQNQHQLPGIVVLCDESYNERCSEIGISTARQLASQGLKVTIYVKSTPKSDRQSKELELFTATGNNFTYAVKNLPKCDLIIMSVKSMNLNSQLVKYIQNNRAPVMAVDPPCVGITDVQIKCSIVPILPLDDLHACGKIYLCNLTIPRKYFTDAGIKYKSPFGNKYVISIQLNE